jgi:hypothetical protein
MLTSKKIEDKLLCVRSPLEETKSWAQNELNNGYNCIEMELFSALKAINKQKVHNHIFSYISDTPLKGVNLSYRLEQLIPRLEAMKLIVNEILNKYHD